MRKTIIGAAMCLFLGYCDEVSAQVQYKIEWQKEAAAFQVALVPQETWTGPAGLTVSGQVSIKAPAGMLEVTNFKNLVNGVVWEFNSKHASPQEAPGYDYFSFGLTSLGTNLLNYQAGIEVPIFSFQNGLDCTGRIELVDNEADAFMPPNSAKANIGNQITVFGANGNAYAGNTDAGDAVCEFASSTSTAKEDGPKHEIYPTVASDKVNVALATEMTTDLQLRVIDASGRLVKIVKQDLQTGKHLIALDITGLSAGTYSVEMDKGDSTNTIGRFIKAGL